MKKTFDQICADILGEGFGVPAPSKLATPASGQQTQQQGQQNQQQQQGQQQNQQQQQPPAVDHDELIKNFVATLTDKNFAAKVAQNQDLQKALQALQNIKS
jgi:hypothetical protein